MQEVVTGVRIVAVVQRLPDLSRVEEIMVALTPHVPDQDTCDRLLSALRRSCFAPAERREKSSRAEMDGLLESHDDGTVKRPTR